MQDETLLPIVNCVPNPKLGDLMERIKHLQGHAAS
jgi:hypothetical protein